MEESLSDPTVPELPPVANTPGSKKKATYRTKEGTSPSREPNWRDVVLSSFEYPEAPFKRIREEIDELRNQCVRMEHINRGVSKALDNCGPINILWEMAKKTDQSKVEALGTEKAQLVAQVVAMTKELAEKSEEIR